MCLKKFWSLLWACVIFVYRIYGFQTFQPQVHNIYLNMVLRTRCGWRAGVWRILVYIDIAVCPLCTVLQGNLLGLISKVLIFKSKGGGERKKIPHFLFPDQAGFACLLGSPQFVRTPWILCDRKWPMQTLCTAVVMSSYQQLEARSEQWNVLAVWDLESTSDSWNLSPVGEGGLILLGEAESWNSRKNAWLLDLPSFLGKKWRNLLLKCLVLLCMQLLGNVFKSISQCSCVPWQVHSPAKNKKIFGFTSLF